MQRPEQQHVVLLLNLPPSSLCGIDLLSFTTSPQFLGLRGVPTGWHFVYISATQSSTIRHGLWIHVGGGSCSASIPGNGSGSDSDSAAAAAAAGDVGDVVIKKFDAATEELVDERDTAERLRWRANLGAVWRERLAPYRQSAGAGSSTTTTTATSGDGGGGGGGGVRTATGGSRQQRQQQRQQQEQRREQEEEEEDEEEEERDDWHKLTDCLSADLLDRVTTGSDRRGETGGGEGGAGGSSNSSSWNNWRLNTASSAAQDVDDIPGLARDAVISEQHIYGAPRVRQESGDRGGGDGGGVSGSGGNGSGDGGDGGDGGGGGGKGAEDGGYYKTGSGGGELHFVPVDLKRTWRAGAIGRERTEAAQDRSWALGHILRTYCGGGGGGGGGGRSRAATHQDQQSPKEEEKVEEDEGEADEDEDEDEEEKERQERYLIGEMQLTFLMTLALANYSCLQQWKRLLGLVLTCRAAVRMRPALFARALRLLRRQLRCSAAAVDGGLFDLSDEGGGFLIQLLKTFRRRLAEMGLEDGEEGEKEENEGREQRRGGGGEGGGGEGRRGRGGRGDGGSGGQDGSGASESGRSKGKRRAGAAAGIAQVRAAFAELEAFARSEFGWELSDSYVRRGMLQLEDGEEVEMEVDELQGEDERGEYAPVIVTL